jgi:hypothetical protein
MNKGIRLVRSASSLLAVCYIMELNVLAFPRAVFHSPDLSASYPLLFPCFHVQTRNKYVIVGQDEWRHLFALGHTELKASGVRATLIARRARLR